MANRFRASKCTFIALATSLVVSACYLGDEYNDGSTAPIARVDGLGGGAGFPAGGGKASSGAAAAGASGAVGKGGASATGGAGGAGGVAGQAGQSGAAGKGGATGQGGSTGQGGATGKGGAGQAGSGATGQAGMAGAGGSSATPCEQLATTVCARLGGCAFGLERARLTASTCHERLTARCETVLGLDGASLTAFDVSLCQGTVSTAACERLIELPFGPCLPKGQRGSGDPCEDGAQCKSGRCLFVGAACGSCTTPGALGDNCSSILDCDADLMCINGKCATLPGPGEGCGGASGCGAGLSCTSGICEAKLPEGSSCSEAAACDQGLTCKQGHCGKVQALGENDPCTYQPNDPQCGPGLACVFTGMDLTCRPLVVDQGSCDAGLGGLTQCLFPATCVDGVCSTATQCN